MSAIILLLLLSPAVLPGVRGGLPLGQSEACYLKNTVYNHGHVLAEKTLPDVDACQRWCQLLDACTHFSYYHASAQCYLRQGNKSEFKDGITSGPKYCFLETELALTNCTTSICLKGGMESHEGDVFVEGLPVCDDSWGLREGAVACRQLGFPGVGDVTLESDFGTIAANYSLDDVHCLGNETSLIECHHKRVNNCGKGEAAGVVCTLLSIDLPPYCHQPQTLCLHGGSESGSGNVYYEGKPVCHNGWDLPDAYVACHSLGYIGVKNYTLSSSFGLGNTYFSLSNINCMGHENSLAECWHSTSGAGCSQNTVAGIICFQQVEQFHVEVPILITLLLLLICVITVLLAVHYRWNRLKKLTSLGDIQNVLRFKNPIVSESTQL